MSDLLEKFPDLEHVRPAVLWFAIEMERNLRANDHKGGWDYCSDGYLKRRLKEEVDELLHVATPRGKVREAADVGNLAMMIADNAERKRIEKQT